MQIAFITDLHIAPEGVNTLDIDVRRHFELVLADIADHRPDLLVVGGDLCFQEPDAVVYRFIKQRLDAAEIPYLILAGNHDSAAAIAEVFGYTTWNGQLVRQTRMGETAMFFLDSSSAELPQNQLEWLQKELEDCEPPVFVFIHHPPLQAHIPFMDTEWPLVNGAALERVLHDFGKQVFVFCGHYHIEKMTISKNITQCITPSCFVQLDQYAKVFKADHQVPAWRIIEWNDGVLHTAVHYHLKPHPATMGW